MDGRTKTSAAAIGLFITFSACSHPPESREPQFGTAPAVPGKPVLVLAVHPLHNPAKLTLVYTPLVDFINSRLRGAQILLETSRDYANFEGKYRAREPELLLPNPWQTLQAIKRGYHVIAMAGEPKDFKGIFVVRKDSPLRQPADLRGKGVSYPAPTALAACIMPQYFLRQNGIDVTREIENRYVGSQESSIMNAYLGLTAAGATWPPPWRAFQADHPREAAALKILWETQPLINNSVMVRDDVAAGLREQVLTLLTSLHTTSEGKSILAGMETVRFISSSDGDYDTVQAFITRFEREVRKVEDQ